MTPDDSAPRNRPPAWVILTGLGMSLIAVLIMAWTSAHLPKDRRFMWEIQYDQFYYAANAKSLLDNGLVVFHANAYDDRADAPRIYSHLYTTLLAFLAFVFRIQPFDAIFILRPIFGILLAWSLWVFLGPIFPSGRWRTAAWWFLMFSGGVAGIGAVIETAASARSNIPLDDLLQSFAKHYFENEGTARDWLCNIARNFLMVPEMMYHAIWFASIGAYLAGRRVLSTAFLALELYAHPFTGPALGLVLGVACLLDAVRGSNRRAAARQMVAVIALILSFAAYAYRLGLDSGHQVLVAQWELFKSEIPIDRYPWIYGIWLPMGLAAAVCLRKMFWTDPAGGADPADVGAIGTWGAGGADPAVRLMSIQAVAVFALSHHHWLIGREFQPAHFSRGYLFAALVVLTLKWMQHASTRIGVWGLRLNSWISRRGVVAAIVTVLSFDSLLYYVYIAARAADPPQAISADRADMIDRLAGIQPAGSSARIRQFVASDPDIGYLLPVFSTHRVLLGHFSTTPNFREKWQLWQDWVNFGDETLFLRYPRISVVVMPRGSKIGAGLNPNQWTLMAENASFVAYRKIP